MAERFSFLTVRFNGQNCPIPAFRAKQLGPPVFRFPTEKSIRACLGWVKNIKTGAVYQEKLTTRYRSERRPDIRLVRLSQNRRGKSPLLKKKSEDSLSRRKATYKGEV